MKAPPGRFRQIAALSEVRAEAWDALFGTDYPFTRHAFLSALETSGSVGPGTGWHPRHLLLEAPDGQLLAACPLYLKDHSYGEFVFDFAWARALEATGRPYYPRLVCAIPFTPSTGPRWAARDAAAEAALLQQLAALTDDPACSSLHALFLPAEAATALAARGALLREDAQYHWFNRDYPDFDAFLNALSADKRKKLKRERRRVTDAGIGYTRSPAAALTPEEWDHVYALYASTYAMRGQAPYLTRAFFTDYARCPDNRLWVLRGHRAGQVVMMALFLQSGDCLYGRHWGSMVELNGAHFETCYYQGIEWCIEAGLRRFDAGTQGEHKCARGFEPVITHSAHWLQAPDLRDAVASFLARERPAVRHHAETLRQQGAYRHAA